MDKQTQSKPQAGSDGKSSPPNSAAAAPVNPVENFDPPVGQDDRRIFQNGDTDRTDDKSA